MSSFTQNLFGIVSGRSIGSHNIIFRQNQNEMGGITTHAVVTDMVKNKNIFALSVGDRVYQPGINQSMNIYSFMMVTGIAITFGVRGASPQPAASSLIKLDSRKNLCSFIGADIIDDQKIIHMCIVSPSDKKYKEQSNGTRQSIR